MALLGMPQLLAFNISFDFFQLNLQKKRTGAVKSIDSACSVQQFTRKRWAMGPGEGSGGCLQSLQLKIKLYSASSAA